METNSMESSHFYTRNKENKIYVKDEIQYRKDRSKVLLFLNVYFSISNVELVLGFPQPR